MMEKRMRDHEQQKKITAFTFKYILKPFYKYT